MSHILTDVTDCLHALGTDRAAGTMVFTICGVVPCMGVFELPVGSALRFFLFKQKTAYEMLPGLEFRRVLFRSRAVSLRAQPSSGPRVPPSRRAAGPRP